MQIKTLALTGEHQAINKNATPLYPGLEQKASLLVGNAVRGTAKRQQVSLKEEELVELVFEDNVKWLGPPDMLEDLFYGGSKRSGNAKGVFEIESSLAYPDATRGIGSAILKVVNVFAKASTSSTKQQIKKLAGVVERKILGMPPGLMSVGQGMELLPFTKVDVTKPVLLLLHGTGSSTQSSFEGLPNTPLWQYWQETYGTNILAFQHETLSKSPLENAVDLVKALPAGLTLHLISHSRGGLLGEVISRFSKPEKDKAQGFTDAEAELFNKAGQANDYNSIIALRALAENKKYKVEKFVRVACPAAGTTILSKRLDYFVNILTNLLAAASGENPAVVALQELLVAIVDQKNDPDVLPGLEAMKPDSLFIRILNSQASTSIPITVPVAVISGNCKIGFNLKSLLVIVSKLFYWEDNDLIVNTGSMYHGSKKTNGLYYFFDEGKEVDHFHYFKNPDTNKAIRLALQAKGTAQIEGFTPWLGSAGDAKRNALLGLDGVHFTKDTPTGKKPIVVLLPGIMGTAIAQDDDLIWVNLLRFVAGDLQRLDIDTAADTIQTPGIISSAYKQLARNLSDSYDVVTFPFDWRRSLIEAAGFFNDKINELLVLNQPIKIIGHSMGGVLVRDFIIHHNDTWQKLKKKDDFRLIFLGSPLGGSHRILNVLFGQDGLIKKLAMVDMAHNMKGLLHIFSRFPGILCLLPLSKDKENDFADPSVWKQMALFHQDCSGFDDIDWPIPDKASLLAFATYRESVLDAEAKGIDYGNAIYVAGKDKVTPCGYRCDNTSRGKELVFLGTAEGDQSVTWESGIPSGLDKKNVYYVNVTHGSLANTPSIFTGIRELLASGTTNQFSRNRPAIRGSGQWFKQPDVLDFDLSPRGIENSILGLPMRSASTKNELPIKVQVSHADLKYADYPLLAGHFKNDSILFAEKRIDSLLQYLLTERHSIGLYPGDIGTSEILLTYQSTGFPGAIIAGLGEPGTLNSFRLTQTVEQAVARYLLIVNGREKIKAPLHQKLPLGISSLIIGCGYGGLSIENSISAILAGITQANSKIRNLYQEEGHAQLIEKVQLIELYEDRALSCYYSLHQLYTQQGRLFKITDGLNSIDKSKPGGRKRINLQQTEDWWNRIEVRAKTNSEGKIIGMNFVLGGNMARQDQRDVFTATATVEKLLTIIAADNQWSKGKARTLYELLMPHDFKDEIKKYGNVVWVLDNYTAGFPWELLHDKVTGSKPICIDSGMIRQLIREDGRTKIDRVNNKTALVIGDPQLDGFAQQLPGAKEEAQMVAALLKEKGYIVPQDGLVGSNPEEILNAMFGEDYKIIHLAGHGEFNEDSDKATESGMLIGNGVYLNSSQIAQLSGTADLVFVNCCYLGETDSRAEAIYQQRYKLAANIGTQLINNGVKAVVVAGWAVEDRPALLFAEKFYNGLFMGYTFGEAVKMARKEVYETYGDNNTNTWGAYQCYGDPFYRLVTTREMPERDFVVAEQAELELENLLSDLQAIESDEDRNWAKEKLEKLSKKIEACGLRNQFITEKEAYVYIELDMADAAIEKFDQLLKFETTDYSFRAIEQYYLLRARKIYKSKGDKDTIKSLESILEGLKALIAIRPTAERYSLLGSTYKKKASICKDVTELCAALQLAAIAYQNAYQHSADIDAIYPFVNWANIYCLLAHAGKPRMAYDGKDKASNMPPTADAIARMLKQMGTAAAKLGDTGSYYDAVRPATVALAEWLLQLLQKKPKPKNINTIVQQYHHAWAKKSAESNKEAELEHLQMLQNSLSIGKPKSKLANEMEQLIIALKGLVQ